MNKKFIFLILILCGHHVVPSIAQDIPLNLIEDRYSRMLQLENSTEYSFAIRPYSRSYLKSQLAEDSLHNPWKEHFNDVSGALIAKNVRVGIYNPIYEGSFNSEFPLGGNDGSLWQGRGFNSQTAAGFYINHPNFELSFRPEVNFQNNQSFLAPLYVPENPDSTESSYRRPSFLSYDGQDVDAPYRFGDDSFYTYNMGASYLKGRFKGFEAGISTQNLWWGPSIRNGMMMSNNAPGFLHGFIGSNRPLDIFIGHLEFKWIWGSLRESDYFDDRPDNNRNFLNAFIFTYSPAVLDGLSVGLIRSLQSRIPEDGLAFRNFVDIFQPFQKRKIGGEDSNFDTIGSQNQIASVYARWLFQEAKAEIYAEYGRDDHAFDFRDFLQQPNHLRAYTIGFQKLIDIRSDRLLLLYEMSNFETPKQSYLRGGFTSFYHHSSIKQGYTNRGQFLGARIGPGSSSQFLKLEYLDQKGSLALFTERFVVDNDLHFFLHNEPSFRIPNGNFGNRFGDFYRHWVNLSLGAELTWFVNNWVLRGGYQWTKAFNYGRYEFGKPISQELGVERFDLVNHRFTVGVQRMF